MTQFIPLSAASVDAGPPGNRMYLVCSAHPDTDDALMLGKRLEGGYSRVPSATDFRAWFDRHAECGVDQYQLAYGKPPAWDQVRGEGLVTQAVKLELVKT